MQFTSSTSAGNLETMDIGTAIRKVRVRRTLGGIFLVFALLFVLLGGLKGLYGILVADATFTSRFSAGIASLIRQLYEHTTGIDLAWRLAPAPDFRSLNNPGNIGFIFCIAIGCIGRYIWDSGSNLQIEIVKAKKRAQGRKWERELEGETSGGQRGVNINIVVNPTPEDEWYKKPGGIILIGVATAALGQWLNLLLGLAKL